jgi:capsular polysaccharide export protein
MQSPHLSGWFRFAGKKVLLLQSPHGPFFQRVAHELCAAGAGAVYKINFNGGDFFYYSRDAIAFRGNLKEWPEFLTNYVRCQAIDCIMVFGDCRPIHIVAKKVASSLGLQFWVFEEGYVRPNFITLEQHGVNGYSQLPRHPKAYDVWADTQLQNEINVPKSFGVAAKCAMVYFTACALLWPLFWRYKHHRNLNILDGLYWVRSYWRKLRYAAKEANALVDLKPIGQRDFFLVILQVATDAQVAIHSSFESIEQFIVHTVNSFAQFVQTHPHRNEVLLFKHHPMDRGYTDYTALIRQLIGQQNLLDRVRYIHDKHLPTLLANAQGVVTINSTVGLSALYHGTPTIALGNALYSMKGLTCQAPLSEFWKAPMHFKPDANLHAKFRNYITTHTQINGSFYVSMLGANTKGLEWRTRAIHTALEATDLHEQAAK